jgi:hypothetical protein
MRQYQTFYEYDCHLGKYWQVDRLVNRKWCVVEKQVVGLRRFETSDNRAEHYTEADADKDDGTFHSDIEGIDEIDGLFTLVDAIEEHGKIIGEDW